MDPTKTYFRWVFAKLPKLRMGVPIHQIALQRVCAAQMPHNNGRKERILRQ